MRALALLVVIVPVLGSRPARAEDAALGPPAAATAVHVALGVNSPLSWPGSSSLGASLYVGIGEHHAIRANIAHYKYEVNATASALSVLVSGEGDEALYEGRTSDVGIGWVYYPRRPWSGWTFELGALRRGRDHRIEDDIAIPEVVATHSTTYAGRAMIGWSWLLYEHVFLALAAGVSVGHESGTETSQRFEGDISVRADVSRLDVHGEGLLRLGVAFDL